MATGTVTFSAATYTPGGEDARRALVTVTPWAGGRVDGEADSFYEITTGSDLSLVLEQTDGTFCYRIVVETPDPISSLVRFVTVPAGPTAFADLPDVNPGTFLPITLTPTLAQMIATAIDEADLDVDPADIEAAVEDYLTANPPAGSPDATGATKGLVQLAGDLSGTAAAPTVPGLAGKAAAAHTHAQGDVTGLAGALAALAPLVHAHEIGDVNGLAAQLALLAPLASPSFTGNPLAPTPSPGDNDTSIATTGFVKAALDALIASAPGTLDTLDELAAALADDPNFATTITTALALKAPLASPAFTGTPTAPTAPPGANTTQLATTAFVEAARVILAAADALKAPLASPTLTGDPKAPTPATADNDTSIATTAFVKAQGYAPLASPALTGNPTAPTPTAGDNDTSIATTAFVKAADDVVLGAVIAKGLVDAKGDLIVGTANDTPARLAIGTDGFVLTADAAEASGMKWAAAAGGGGSGSTGDVQFSVPGQAFGTNLSPSTFTTYPFSVTPDVNIGGGSWDTTNFVYTVPEDGLYLCLGGVRMPDNQPARSLAIGIGTANADAHFVYWETFGGDLSGRSGRQYARLTRFSVGDPVRLFIFSQDSNFPTNGSGGGQFLSITKLAD